MSLAARRGMGGTPSLFIGGHQAHARSADGDACMISELQISDLRVSADGHDVISAPKAGRIAGRSPDTLPISQTVAFPVRQHQDTRRCT